MEIDNSLKMGLNIKNSRQGFTFIEVLVGTFLILVVFLGIVGAYRLGIQALNLSKNRIAAAAIAGGRIEMIRSLAYHEVGTLAAKLPFSKGVLDSSTTTVRNGVEFEIQTEVKFISDDADGTGENDDCDLDYKKAQVKVIWTTMFGGEVKLVTDVAPKSLIEEINSCVSQPAGLLSVEVFDAFGSWGAERGAPLIEIFDPVTDDLVDFFEPLGGKHNFPLAPGNYRAVVSKSGYSAERTYSIDEIAIPAKPNPTVFENKSTNISFSIDKTSSFSVDTLSTWGTDSFYDSFNDESKISATSSVVVADGEVNLFSDPEIGYVDSGFVISKTISPFKLAQWSEFLWNDFKESATTTVSYQALYYGGTDWLVIPDEDLADNESGFVDSPVSLIGLATTTYPEIRVKAILSTSDASTTPAVYSWQVSWTAGIATPIGNAEFTLQGDKLLGYDSDEESVYKYSVVHLSDSNGRKDIPGLEWDSYTFSVDPESGLDLVGIVPSEHPIGLPPDSSIDVSLYLDSQDSLLLSVQDSITLEPVFSGEARLYNTGLNYDKVQYTDKKGQTYFVPLEPAVYDLEVSSAGYSSVLTSVSVSGAKTKTINLERVE